MVCLKEMFINGETTFHFKKETEKIVLLQMKGLIQIIAKFRNVSHHPQNTLLRGMKYCAPCERNTPKSNKLEVDDGSLKENKLACMFYK